MENLIVATACGGGVLYSLFHVGRSLIAQRWPSVEGEVASTRLVHRLDRDGPTDYDYVAYRYEVDGKPYRNDRVWFGPQVVPSSVVPGVDPEPNNNLYGAAALARRYPKGAPVRVYYNPRNPADSVLHRAPSFAIWVGLSAFLLFGWLSLRALL